MRRLYLTEELGVTRAALRWGVRNGRWQRIDRGVWAEGSEVVSTLDRARAAVMATGGVASHHLAGVLHGLDSVRLDGLWITLLPTAGAGDRGRVAGSCRRDAS